MEHDTTSLRVGNLQLARTGGYFAAFLALGLATATLGPALPSLAEHTRTHLGEISFLFTARALGYLLGSFLAGRLYDRTAGHRVMAAGLIAMSLTLAMAPIIGHLWLLTLVMMILGMSEGTVDVGGNTLLVWVHGRRVGPFMNALHFFFGLGAFVSPIVIAQALFVSGDINWAFWTLALLPLPMAVWLLAQPSPPAPATTRDALAPDSSTAQAESSRYEQLMVALIAILLFLYVGAEAGFGGWIYTYALALDLGTVTSAAYLTSAFWGALTFGRLLAIPIAARLRPRWILLGDLLGCLAGVGVLLLWPSSQTATLLGTLSLGFFMASIFPTALTLAEHRMTITGRITGWFFVGASAGGMVLPWLIGQLFESAGPGSAMIAIAIDLVLALAVFGGLMLCSTGRLCRLERLLYNAKGG